MTLKPRCAGQAGEAAKDGSPSQQGVGAPEPGSEGEHSSWGGVRTLERMISK